MGLETGSYVGDLNAANPSGTDPKSQGDDHIRLLKTAARNSFPGFAGVVAGTGVESGSGSAFVVALSPAPAAYAAGMLVVFKATHANTGPATLQVNALSTKTLKGVDGSALESGDIEAGAIVGAFYDGTDFFLISGADRAARGGDSYTGAHDFSGASVQVATAGAGDNSTKAASTAYVDAADALKANLASPTLTGVPTAPTAAPGTNTTQLATTAFATQLAFQAALPVQSGPSMLYSNGSAASWRAAFVGDSGAGGELGPVPAPAAGDASKFLKADGTWHLAPSAPDVIVQDQRASGTGGGSLSLATWNVRTLNTVVRNQGALGSLTSNTLTLTSGTWLLRARASVSGGAGVAPVARTRIRNTTDGITAGASEPITVVGTGGLVSEQGATQEAVAIVTIASSKAFQLQTYVAASTGSGGMAVSSGEVEIYATFEATRIQ